MSSRSDRSEAVSEIEEIRANGPRVEFALGPHGFTVYAESLPLITVASRPQAKAIAQHIATTGGTDGLSEFDEPRTSFFPIRHVERYPFGPRPVQVEAYADEHECGQLRIAAPGEQRSLLPLPDETIPTSDEPRAVDEYPPEWDPPETMLAP